MCFQGSLSPSSAISRRCSNSVTPCKQTGRLSRLIACSANRLAHSVQEISKVIAVITTVIQQPISKTRMFGKILIKPGVHISDQAFIALQLIEEPNVPDQRGRDKIESDPLISSQLSPCKPSLSSSMPVSSTSLVSVSDRLTMRFADHQKTMVF